MPQHHRHVFRLVYAVSVVLSPVCMHRCMQYVAVCYSMLCQDQLCTIVKLDCLSVLGPLCVQHHSC